jgi:diguanylate cyclase (GGDEF)-like protein
MLLNDRLTQTIALARRHSKSLAVLFLDVDHFKRINDSLGHAIGDQLLKSIAERLVACVRSSDTVSRQGGDEFVVLLSEVARAEDVARTADKILAAVSRPHRIGYQDLHITASVGIGVYPTDGADAETLLKNADRALFRAKSHGRSNHQFFKPATHEPVGSPFVRWRLEDLEANPIGCACDPASQGSNGPARPSLMTRAAGRIRNRGSATAAP